jgi:hypothetical protein
VECVAGFRKFRSFNPHPTLTVIMPYLRRLSVEEDRVLLHLEAPLLEELTSVWVGSSTVLLPFIRRSSCTLKKLLLMRCTMISSDLIAVLQSLPSLTYLLLAMDEDEENEGTVEQGQVALFSAMHLSGVPSDICPNLTSFVFGYRRAFPWQSFFAMAQTRFQPETGGQCHLSFLRIFDADLKITYPQDMVTGTRLLQEEGLDVALVDVDSEEQLRSSFSTSFFSHY